MTTEVVLPAREWRKINRKNRRYRQQIKRHPEKKYWYLDHAIRLKNWLIKPEKKWPRNVILTTRYLQKGKENDN